MTVSFVRHDSFSDVSRVYKSESYTDIYKYIKYSDGYKEELIASILNANITLITGEELSMPEKIGGQNETD
jgi:hypothetical protein